MYLTENIFQKYAVYESGTDQHFFHSALMAAKYKYQLLTEDENFDGTIDIEKIKKFETPVFYFTTVSKFTKDDVHIERIKMNERARSKFIVVDADYDSGEESTSELLRKRIIALGEEYQTPVVIYPSISYPEKPRFRAILFVSRQLTEDTYYKAVKWLFNTLDMKSNDLGNYNIKSNNNCPIFVNDDQINAIYDTTQNKNLKPLDNKLWKDYDGKPEPQKPDLSDAEEDVLDEYIFSDMDIELIGEMFSANETVKYYSQFWPLMHSFARAEFNEQITDTQAEYLLEKIAEVDAEDHLIGKWKKDNVVRYHREKTRVFNSQHYLDNAQPLAAYAEVLLIINLEEVAES